MNYLPAILTFDPPSKQNSLSVYRSLKLARELIENIEAKDQSHEDRIQVAMDDLKLMMSAVK